MLKKIIKMSKKPKKPLPINVLMGFLLVQAFLLLITLLVVVFWPERAHATLGFVFMSFGISLWLWVDIREAGIERAPIEIGYPGVK
jgi:hypothetical protein